MEYETKRPLVASRELLPLPGKANHVDLPDWDTARHLIFPFLEPISDAERDLSGILAQTAHDPLSGMVSSYIKMSLALFYRGAVIPLTETLIREWAIGVASVRLAMDRNVALVARSARFDSHRKCSLTYYSVHSDAAPFNSVLPFYTPFQETVALLLGSPFYFVVPERRSVILFGKEVIPRYREEFRDDVLLTYETSTSFLSPELIEVSESGVLPVYR